MELPLYHIDVFSDKVFSGNPAAVCLLNEWLPDTLLQSIAGENFLPATAFVVSQQDKHEIRFFSPTAEMELCGHGILAAAYVMLRWIHPWLDEVTFHAKHTEIPVRKQQDNYILNFPVESIFPTDVPEGMEEALGVMPRHVFKNPKWHMAVIESERQLRHLKPNFHKLAEIGCPKLIVTAPGDRVDFVSRYFKTEGLFHEDPVTGTAHCVLMPYWARRLSKTRLHAQQVSERSGNLLCELRQDRVLIKGHAIAYLQGTMTIPVHEYETIA